MDAPPAGPVSFGCYPAPTQAPMLTDPDFPGVSYDFNVGARLVIDPRPPGAPDWTVRMRDLDTGNTLFEGVVNQGMVFGPKNYFVRYGFEIEEAGKVIWQHDYDCRNKLVAIHFPVGTLGDILAWFPYAVKFADKHDCMLMVTMSEKIIPLLAPTHTHIRFMTPDEFTKRKMNDSTYASYYLGLFFDDPDRRHQPIDFRQAGLHRTAAHILGVEPVEERVEIHWDGRKYD